MSMDINELISTVDHTVLKQDVMWCDIKKAVDDAIKYATASVCIPPCFVKRASDYAKGKVKICTVIGFPNGYSTLAVKCFEASDAVKNGADEIDMVINISDAKEGKFEKILEEINEIKKSCRGKLLKVIVETCLLTEKEKIKMCEVVSFSHADYIKTSTGFSFAGATKDDVRLFSEHIKNGKKIKAAGGISDLEDAWDFIELGASRLGTSRIISLIENK